MTMRFGKYKNLIDLSGAPGRSRTSDLLIRSLVGKLTPDSDWFYGLLIIKELPSHRYSFTFTVTHGSITGHHDPYQNQRHKHVSVACFLSPFDQIQEDFLQSREIIMRHEVIKPLLRKIVGIYASPKRFCAREIKHAYYPDHSYSLRPGRRLRLCSQQKPRNQLLAWWQPPAPALQLGPIGKAAPCFI